VRNGNRNIIDFNATAGIGHCRRSSVESQDTD